MGCDEEAKCEDCGEYKQLFVANLCKRCLYERLDSCEEGIDTSNLPVVDGMILYAASPEFLESLK